MQPSLTCRSPSLPLLPSEASLRLTSGLFLACNPSLLLLDRWSTLTEKDGAIDPPTLETNLTIRQIKRLGKTSTTLSINTKLCSLFC